MESYGYTIKFNQSNLKPTKETYEEVLTKWRAHDPSLIVVYEDDSKGRLHAHGTIQLPKNFYRGKLNIKGLHWKLERIYDADGWHRYINKEQIKNSLKKSLFKNI